MTEVTLSVNGTSVTLDVEPRLALADVLRQRLGLTGTHLGCEHGVCGACTVLIDGAAARSCLIFCVQAAGAEVTTVEALGDPDDLHPLQEAFRRHHGLQCGFCTPGFLISAYELLRDGSDGLDDERRLREELSGVLCRCTGYAGIVAAVREVAAAYPDGLPALKALGRPINARGVGVPAPAVVAQPTSTRERPPELTVPEGPPNETVSVTTSISAAPAQTWELLRDFPRMSRCIPGVELGTSHDDETYSGHVRVNLGPMHLSFAGVARVLERDDDQRSMRAIAAGRDPSGSGVRADFTVRARAASGGGTDVNADAKLYLTGRAAQFGRSLAGDVSRQVFAEFGRCVERTASTGEAIEPHRLRGGALAWQLIVARVRAALRRWRGS
jgi:aerobic-type carbon monoxide dehydrogenase small subunit (CoxS/CutS family)/carbon monoxide dehydrogenase subunit G